MAAEFSLTAAAFGDVSAWVAFSVITIVRRSVARNRLDGIVGHYELTSRRITAK